MASDGTETPVREPAGNWLETAPNRVEKETLEGFLPEGFLRQYGSDYLNHLPNVQEQPLTPSSFLQKADNTWSEYGVAYLLLYPYVVLLLLLLGVGVYFLTRRIRKKLEIKRRHPCPVCRNPVFSCALFCQVCGTPNAHPTTMDFLGFPRKSRFAILETHSDLLRSFRRCPRCATHLPRADSHQNCPACHTPVFRGIRQKTHFDRFVQKRFWHVFLVLTLVGFVPIIGSLLAVSLYRRRLIEPYSLYLSMVREGLSMVALTFMRYLFRFVPFIGIVGIPLLAVVENYIYRRAFLIGKKKGLGNGRL